jgi:hypothetical protein
MDDLIDTRRSPLELRRRLSERYSQDVAQEMKLSAVRACHAGSTPV